MNNSEKGITESIESNEQKSLENLQNALRTLHETEQIAQETSTRLKEQRDTIQRIKKHNQDIHEELTVSQRILNKFKSWFR